jgi:hypothetical protein
MKGAPPMPHAMAGTMGEAKSRYRNMKAPGRSRAPLRYGLAPVAAIHRAATRQAAGGNSLSRQGMALLARVAGFYPDGMKPLRHKA